MSNNKQSSVEWQHIELMRINFEYATNKITPREYQEQTKNALEQAKAMNKEQHRQTANVVRQEIFDLNYSSFDEYYNEHYGK